MLKLVINLIDFKEYDIKNLLRNQFFDGSSFCLLVEFLLKDQGVGIGEGGMKAFFKLIERNTFLIAYITFEIACFTFVIACFTFLIANITFLSLILLS